jgi:hypothetical protein
LQKLAYCEHVHFTFRERIKIESCLGDIFLLALLYERVPAVERKLLWLRKTLFDAADLLVQPNAEASCKNDTEILSAVCMSARARVP